MKEIYDQLEIFTPYRQEMEIPISDKLEVIKQHVWGDGKQYRRTQIINNLSNWFLFFGSYYLIWNSLAFYGLLNIYNDDQIIFFYTITSPTLEFFRLSFLPVIAAILLVGSLSSKHPVDMALENGFQAVMSEKKRIENSRLSELWKDSLISYHRDTKLIAAYFREKLKLENKSYRELRLVFWITYSALALLVGLFISIRNVTEGLYSLFSYATVIVFMNYTSRYYVNESVIRTKITKLDELEEIIRLKIDFWNTATTKRFNPKDLQASEESKILKFEQETKEFDAALLKLHNLKSAYAEIIENVNTGFDLVAMNENFISELRELTSLQYRLTPLFESISIQKYVNLDFEAIRQYHWLLIDYDELINFQKSLENKIRIRTQYQVNLNKIGMNLIQIKIDETISVAQISSNLDLPAKQIHFVIKKIIKTDPNIGSYDEKAGIFTRGLIKSNLSFSSTFQFEKMLEERRCCKLSGRNKDQFCDICGRVIPEEMILS